ncbi:MAG: endonuclease III [Clostridia bacterium]|nr:endonuclease III [Clostridia bacterium]
MTLKEKAINCVEALKKEYPDAICSLEAKDPLQLLIATRLSAQCTDARVNLVTPALFEKYPSLDAFCEADVADVEKIIHSCGFFRAKAKDIVGMAKKIKSDFGGRVPDSIEKLTSLPGVGRKTANLIMGDVYKKPAVVADTHLIRITNLLGLVSVKDPYKVELALKKILPPEESNDFCHRVVLHGRAVCVARRPDCEHCCLNEFCDFFRNKKEPQKKDEKN